MSRRLVAVGVLVLGAGFALALQGVREAPEGPEVAGADSCPVTSAPPGHRGPQVVRMTDVRMAGAFATYFDPEHRQPGQISYTLEEDALVSIKVKNVNTRELFLCTIVDWEPRTAGRHTEAWDGRDASGNLLRPTDVQVVFRAEAMSSYAPGSLAPEDRLSYGEASTFEADGWEGHAHARHATDAEGTPLLAISSPAAGDTLSGLVWVRAEVDRDRRGYGDEFGYGVRYYVDHVLANEEFYKAESDGRFGYRLDTTAFEDGEHLLQVGMCDHNQHQTSHAVRVVIRNGLDL